VLVIVVLIVLVFLFVEAESEWIGGFITSVEHKDEVLTTTSVVSSVVVKSVDVGDFILGFLDNDVASP
jgi:hypothetical protein